MSSLHIVHVVCTDAFAGVERYVRTSAVCLARAGCRVTVVGGAAESMRPLLVASGVRWMPGSTVPGALRSLSRARRPDVIVTHMTRADFVGVITGAFRRIPVVSTRHFASVRGSSALSRVVSARIRHRITAQIAISQFVAQNVEGSTTVVHTGVADVELAKREREPVVLVLQRLEAEKHTEWALRAWAQVTESAGWRLGIAGDGSDLDSLHGLAGALGIAGSVDFLGFQTDVDALLGRVSVLLAPTPREGLGLAVIEAMAHGVPVVACGAGGHLETAGEVDEAALFDPGDTAAAAGHLARLIRDRAERERYGDALRERQRTEFSLQAQTEATLRVLARAVER